MHRAPSRITDALEVARQKNLRLWPPARGPADTRGEYARRRRPGVQSRTHRGRGSGAGQGGPSARADDAERAALVFAWKVCKHVKSNAIVLARTGSGGVLTTVGVGAGQMSRVESVRIACSKAGDLARGAVLASDAFFPFPDGVEMALGNGVTAIAQPGGSVKDADVIAAADKPARPCCDRGAELPA